MILITGGAYQGKIKYAANRFSLKENEIVNGNICTCSDVLSAKCVVDFHLLIKRLIDKNEDPIEFIKKFCIENPKAIVITDEIGSGIIPIEKNERIWREASGRAGCMLAENSDEVVRIHCGIPIVIKGNLT